MTDERTPTPVQGAASFVCPRCDAYAAQVWSTLYNRGPSGGPWAQLNDVAPWEDEPTWTVATCAACHRSTLWRDIVIAYPATSSLPAPHADMPKGCLELYEEARAVSPISRRASAALARAALESLLKELRPDFKGNLDDRLAAVHPEVSSSLWELLTVLRHAGNKSLHGTDTPDEVVALILKGDAELLEAIFESVNGLVDELIVKPRQRHAIFERLPEGVRAEAERKAARAASPTGD